MTTKTQYYEEWVDWGDKRSKDAPAGKFLATVATKRESNLNSKR